MKNIALLIIICFTVIASPAQVKLSGTVADSKTNDTLVGAAIYFPELKRGVVSDINGDFIFTGLPKGNYLLNIKYVGYATQNISLRLSKDTSLRIQLISTAAELNDVVVTGVSKATEARRSPEPIVSIDQKYMKLNTATNAIDVLTRIPGFSALSTGPNVSKPFIRGLGYNRVLTLFDGIRQDGQQWGDEHGIEMDEFLIDHVEIVKGPASLMYGSDALAGVVNLMPVNAVPEGVIRADVQGNFQSNNLQLGGTAGMQGNLSGYNFGFRVSHKQATDYQNKVDGRVYGTKYNETDFNANAGISKTWGYSNLNFSLFDNKLEIADGSRDSATRKFTKQITEEDTVRPIARNEELSNYKIGVIHQRVQHYRAFWQNYFIIGKSRLGINIAYQLSHRREYSHPGYPDLAGLNLLLHTTTFDVKYYFPEFGGFNFVFGFTGFYQRNINNGATDFVIPDFTCFDIGPFLHIKKQWGEFDVSAGIRYDIRSFSNRELYTTPNSTTGFDMATAYNPNDSTISKQFDSYKHVFSGVSASLGATYNINEHFVLKLNFARGYRSPNIAEISAKGVHPGTGFEQLGDINLKPEFNLQGDFGAFYYSQHVTVSIEGFYNYLQNYIFNQKLLSVYGGDSLYTQAGSGTQFPVFKFIQTNAELYGGEVSIDIHPHPLDWLHFENSISLLYARNLGGSGAVITDSTKYLPFIPPLHTNHVLRAEFAKRISCFQNIFFEFGMQYYAAQNRIFSAYGTETFTPGYILLDAGLGTDFVTKKGKKVFSLSIIGTNLEDKAYQSNMSRLKYFDNYPVNGTGRSGIYNMGRNITLKLAVPLEFEVRKK